MHLFLNTVNKWQIYYLYTDFCYDFHSNFTQVIKDIIYPILNVSYSDN